MTKSPGRFSKTAAPRRVAARPSGAPFSDFLERDQARQRRDRSRRRTFAISLGIHLLALVVVLAYSLYQVDELFGPSVEVKVMDPSKLPPGVLHPMPFVPPKAAPSRPAQP
jgi:hypothetical protein